MTKFNSVDALAKHRDEAKKKIDNSKIQIRIAMATCSIAAGSKAALEAVNETLAAEGIKDAVITQTGCLGFCYVEPTIEVTLPGKEPVVFGDVDAKKAKEIISKYVKKGEMVGSAVPANYEIV